ncbi:hypothetical protein QL285_032416 [Trifolium repens]|nr:hypothetical protein QL285_032416 [Trifolium repens]
MCIRDYCGNFIREQTIWRKGIPLPHEAEAWSLKEALHWIKNFGYTNVSIELDCKLVIDGIVSNPNSQTEFGAILSRYNPFTIFIHKIKHSLLFDSSSTHSIIRSSKLPPSIVASSRPITARLPHHTTALKLRSLSATPLRSQSSSRVFPRRGSVVCEARDTAVEAMGRKKKLNIGSRMLKESNQGSNATNTTSTHAQGSSAEETHRTLPHAQGSSVEETHSNPTQMEDDTNDSEDSHYIPSDIEAEEAYIEKVVEPKRLRGPTRMQDVWDMDADDIIIVNLDKKGQPTGQEGSNLTRFIGSMVRRKEYASIGYISWKDMPDNDKSEMLKLIEFKYEFVPPINDTTRQMLKSEINERWKQWKSDLKSKAYDPSKTEEEVASVKPDSRVDLNQWRKLVHHWFSEEGQKKNSNGRSPTSKEIYIETRTRKDGSIVNENARRVIEKLNKYDNETGTSQSVEEIQSDMPWKDDIYSKVKGTEKREDVNEILRAARQVTNASNAPDQTDSPSSYTDED